MLLLKKAKVKSILYIDHIILIRLKNSYFEKQCPLLEQTPYIKIMWDLRFSL